MTEEIQLQYDRKFFEEGYERALSMIKQCASEHGFYASPTDVANYQRVWGRDGNIIGITALVTGDEELIETCKRTLKTLKDHQGPHGEIPSNVDPNSQRISYGGMAGRVDADLWFIIGCAEYWKKTGDDSFLDEFIPAIEKTVFLLGAWEFNNRGLLYIPETGDWADEYLQEGYVLYDQLLYLQALRSVYEIRKYMHGSEDHNLRERIVRLKNMIFDNYWILDGDSVPEHVYHEILYKKTRHAREYCIDRYWLPFFTPHGYGYRFDSMSNVFAYLVGKCPEERSEKVDRHIDKIIEGNDIDLLPAFHPVIKEVDEDWKDLKMTFSYNFKNRPYEYHNGGLWPLITGFYVAGLVERGKHDRAVRFMEGLHRANTSAMDGDEWSFPEYIHGKDFTPGGTKYQGWSASAAVLGHNCLFNNKRLFLIK